MVFEDVLPAPERLNLKTVYAKNINHGITGEAGSYQTAKLQNEVGVITLTFDK